MGGSEYFDAVNTPLSVWGLGIGSGSQGRNTLYFGSAQAYVTTNAGGKWTELSADPQSNAVPPLVTWKARGDTNAVITYSVVTDSRAPGRLYYGDTDNFLQISYDGGLTFAKEGAPDWGRLSDTSVNPPVPQPINGDSCTAILLDKDYPGHVGSPNRIYAGISTGDIGGGALRVGVAQGDFDPAAASKNPWTWKPLGDQRTFPQTGGVDLVRDDSGNFYAAVYGAGVYKLSSGATPSTPWTRACLSPTDCSNWLPAPPNGWETYRIARDVTSGRLYVSAGYPYATSLQPAADTGVWESANNGATWNKINDASIDQEAITALLPDGPNTLFVATTYSEEATTTDGGVYRGERGSNGTWTWTRALAQPKVTGIAISPADSSLLYAFSGQVCCYSGPDVPGQQAGIWKSTGGGKAGTWGSAPLSNNGLMDLIHARLSFSENDTHTLYASTAGAGLFEGTITCTDQVRDFECSTRLNPASPLILDGVVTSGSVNSLAAGSLDDTYQVFAESGNGSKKKLTLVWTFAGAQAGIGYNLRVEGFLNPTSNDSFAFSYATRASGTCTGHEPTWTNLSPPLTVATPDDQIQSYGLGALPAGTTVFCVRVQDSRTSGDSQADTLTLDRVYLLPT